MHELEGIILASAESYIKKRQLYTGVKVHNSSDVNDSFTKGLSDILLNFGVEVIAKRMNKRTEHLTAKAAKFIKTYRDIFGEEKNIIIDSGGFQILGGYVPHNFIDYLSMMYTDYIAQSKDVENMYFMFVDVNPIVGISPEFATASMSKFMKLLEEKTEDNNQKSKVYAVYHCNTPLAYNTFLNFFKDERIPERLSSHRYAVGGMVMLDFNVEHLQIKPYLYPLFEVIERERERLNNGEHVWFHILGTSGFYEQFLILWIMLYFKLIGWNLHITFDSTTALSKVTKANNMYHIAEDNKTITNFDLIYELVKNKPNNSKRVVETNEWYFMDIVRRVSKEVTPRKEYEINNIEDCFEKHPDGKIRRTMAFSNAAVIYEFWAFSTIYNIFKESVFSTPEIITDLTGITRYEHLMNQLTEFLFIKSVKSFNKKTYRAMNNSLEYLIRFVEKKISIDSIRQMCFQDMASNENWLSFKEESVIL